VTSNIFKLFGKTEQEVIVKQKVIGVLLILACVAILALTARGTTPEERNGTVALFLFPLGLLLIFSRQNWLHKG
jgi:hypothetical protein